MNLQQLYYFKAIAELEHYTRASEALAVSQSSLSHAIHGLEEELGVELFVRSGRNVVLTQYGRMLLPHVARSLETLEAGLAELRHAIEPDTGIVTLACFPSLAQFIPDIIVRYISETQRVNVRIQTNQEATYYELREQILSGKVNLLFATEIKDPRIACAPIGEHRLALLVPHGHRLAGLGPQESVDLKELDGEDLIAYSKQSQLRPQLDAVFRRLGVHPRITMETDQDVIIYGLVGSGRGVAVTPRPLGGTPYNVNVLPIREDEIRRELYLMWNTEAYMSPAAACFRDFIVERGLVFDEYRRRNHVG